EPHLNRLRSVMFKAGKRTLMVNKNLAVGQQLIAVAREIGVCRLGLKQRSTTSPPRHVNSFDQVLNDFKASYFAGALLMPRDVILPDIEAFFEQTTFQPERLQAMITKYNVMPEILCYRLSELIPEHFGLDLHFLRFNDANNRYQIIKQLNLNNLPVPTGFGFKEHYCRRWLTVRLLQEMEGKEITPEKPLIGVQLSEFLDGSGHFLCFGFSRPLMLSLGTNASVILGFRVTPDLEKTIRFAKDPAIPETMITGTCERCSLPKSECSLRSAEPEIWLETQRAKDQKEALKRLMARSKG
ncbi:MAG: ImmA/IrrE family metallo-endopeptidase, partial [Candidatus Promineifilaceae bacterium]